MKKLKTVLFAVCTALSAAVVQAEAVEGKDYIVRNNVIEAVQPDKIEVVEFFGYFCPHCQRLDPIILRHVRTLPADTVYRTEHVVWQPQHLPFARLLAAVNQAGVKRQANPAIFQAVINEGKNLGDETTFRAWAQQQAFGSKLLAAYDDPKSSAAAQNMQQLTERYQIQSTPQVIVGGKYELTFANGFEAGMKTLDELVAKVRTERGMPAAAPKAVLPSRGGAFARQANQ